MIQQSLGESEIEYPESDGKPIAESPVHFSVFAYLLNGLMSLFRKQADIYVGGGNFLYYQEGNPALALVPDIFIVRGLDKAPRRTFKTWVEKRVPTSIIEITSPETIEQDLGIKKLLYQQLGVVEYFLYDPESQALDPPLLGFRREAGEYKPIANANSKIESNEFGFSLQLIEGNLRIIQMPSGYIFPTAQEASEELRQVKGELTIANETAREAQARARILENENARLRAELEKLRAKQD